jgi:phenylalanyl-tRNA synthetase beta chain
MVRSLGVAGQVYAGVFAVQPAKLHGEAARRRHRDFSLFPAALRDLALVVDEATPAGEVRQAVAKIARAAGGPFTVEAVEIFDVYRGEGVPAGKKSVACSLVFRSAERTLTDEEVNAALHQIQAEVARTTPYQIRQ